MVPGARRRGRPGRAARARRPRLGPARRRAATWRRRCRAMAGGPITTVLPTTTATALTSITTGAPAGRARRRRLPDRTSTARCSTCCAGRPPPATPARRSRRRRSSRMPPFLGHRPPVVTRAEFARTGFTAAHLDGVRFRGYRVPSTLVTEVGQADRGRRAVRLRLLRRRRQGRHEYGLGEHYDAELAAADRLVGRRPRPPCPPGTAVVVTADHGQVDVGDRRHAARPDGAGPRVAASRARAGSAGCTPGRAGRRRCSRRPPSAHGDQAWVRDAATRWSTSGWFGPTVSAEAAGPARRRRAGRPRPTSPSSSRPTPGRSSWSAGTARRTPAEMRVPLLAAIAWMDAMSDHVRRHDRARPGRRAPRGRARRAAAPAERGAGPRGGRAARPRSCGSAR